MSENVLDKSPNLILVDGLLDKMRGKYVDPANIGPAEIQAAPYVAIAFLLREIVARMEDLEAPPAPEEKPASKSPIA